MKILVATGHTQGANPNDYHHCVERELVWFHESCGFAGAASHRATTTAMVVESGMTRRDVVLAFETSLSDGGWPPAWAQDVADDNLEIAAQLPVGAIVTRQLESVVLRGALFS